VSLARVQDVQPPAADLERIDAKALSQGIAATPLDQFVIWDGTVYEGRPGSRTTRALSLVTEAWQPISLRELIMRASRLDGDCGLPPETVRNAVRQHQRARGAGYLWVRRTPAGDYVLVTDVPFPASRQRPTAAGAVVLSRDGRRFET
jgi:hypothetical protein